MFFFFIFFGGLILIIIILSISCTCTICIVNILASRRRLYLFLLTTNIVAGMINAYIAIYKCVASAIILLQYMQWCCLISYCGWSWFAEIYFFSTFLIGYFNGRVNMIVWIYICSILFNFAPYTLRVFFFLFIYFTLRVTLRTIINWCSWGIYCILTLTIEIVFVIHFKKCLK